MNELHDIEDRLRDATHAYADRVEPAPDAWDRIATSTRAANRRRRAIWIGGTSAVAAAAVFAGTLLLSDDDPTRRVNTPVATTPTTVWSGPPVRDRGPSVSLLPLPSDDTDTNVEVRVVGLLPGEVGRIEVCPWAGFVCSADPVRSYTVVGTGSDDLTVNVAARGFGSMGLWLYVNDVLAPPGGIPVPRIPGSAEQLPPGTLDVSPASVPGPDHYTFTVTGSGWTAEGPIFVWACSSEIVLQEFRGYPMECGSGDTEIPATRARVTPVDGAFTVERPYAPGQDFFIIASDGAQTQVATFRVKFGKP